MAGASEEPGQGSESLTAKENVPRIAEAWGTSRAYVYKLKKRGCPAHDVEAATKWRDEHAVRGTGYRSKAAGEPPASLRKDAKAGAEAPETRSRGKAVGRGERPSERVLGSMWDSLEAAIAIESEAYRLVKLAQHEQNDALIGVRIAAYTKAQQGRFDAEERYRKEKERQRILIPFEEAKRIGRRAYDIMLPLLRAMGKNLGPRVSPSDALAAVEMIDNEVEAIIKAGRGEYEPVAKELPHVTIEIPDEEEGTPDVGDPS